MDSSTLVPLTPQIVLDLQWWLDPKNTTRGAPLGSPPPKALLFTDASTEGWGAHLLQQNIAGTWSPEEKTWHINVLEMKAVLLALQHFSPQFQGQSLGIMSDNSTVVAYLNNRGARDRTPFARSRARSSS